MSEATVIRFQLRPNRDVVILDSLLLRFFMALNWIHPARVCGCWNECCIGGISPSSNVRSPVSQDTVLYHVHSPVKRVIRSLILQATALPLVLMLSDAERAVSLRTLQGFPSEWKSAQSVGKNVYEKESRRQREEYGFVEHVAQAGRAFLAHKGTA